MASNYFVNPYGYNTIKANFTGWELPLHLLFFPLWGERAARSLMKKIKDKSIHQTLVHYIILQ